MSLVAAVVNKYLERGKKKGLFTLKSERINLDVPGMGRESRGGRWGTVGKIGGHVLGGRGEEEKHSKSKQFDMFL